MKEIKTKNVEGKTLVVRADLNVPTDQGRVTDTTRIDRFAQGMRLLLKDGARLVILSHFGRPKGERKPEFSMEFLKADLSKALGVEVKFAPDLDAAHTMSEALANGEALLVENIRFEAGEEKNDAALAKKLAALGDVYVNDAFSVSHRAHASTEAIAHELPAFAGPLMAEEVNALQKALENPERPAVAIVGGAKVSTKIDVLQNLAAKLDAIIIGGGMANTFFYADGHPVGKSLCEKDEVETIKSIRAAAEKSGCQLLLPIDIVAAKAFEANAENVTLGVDECPDDDMILDAGPQSIAAFNEALDGAKTILWNGPLGAFEIKPFDQATNAVAKHAAKLTREGKVISVAGGGDTVAALNVAGVADDFSYISSAGGAFLEWIEGKELPGVAALG